MRITTGKTRLHTFRLAAMTAAVALTLAIAPAYAEESGGQEVIAWD